MESRPEKNKRSFFASRAFLLVLFFGLFLVSFAYIKAYYQDYKVRQEIKSLQSEVKNLEKKKIESLEILKYVISPEFVEEKARTELNMKKPGEHVIIVTDQVAKPDNVDEETAGRVLLPNPSKWWYYFINKSINSN